MSLGINLILLAIQVIGMILVFSVILQAKYSRYKQLAISTIVVGIEVAIAYVKLNVNVYTIMNNILIFCLNVIIILFLILGYKDKMWKKIIIYILVYMVNIIGEIASCKIYYQVFNREVVIAKNMVPVIYIQSTLITCFLLFMVCVAWKFFLYQNKRKIVYKCLIVSLILIQLFIVIRADRWMMAKSELDLKHEYIVIAIWGLLSDFVLIMMILGEKKNRKMNECLQELECIQQIEVARYCAIEEKEEEITKIRHDFKNQINTAYNLLALSDKQQAEEFLKEMAEKLTASETRIYSNNAIVNSVMQEKAKLCEEKQIALESSIKIGEIEGIKMVHICSVFSNLLDNAIHATEGYKGEKYIKVSAKMQGDYLIVQVKNASDNPKYKKGERRGYGREILKEIAATYEGESDYSWEENEYKAIVTLLCNSGGKNR